MRLRGLPFEAGREEVRRFFEGTYVLFAFKTQISTVYWLINKIKNMNK